MAQLMREAAAERDEQPLLTAEQAATAEGPGGARPANETDPFVLLSHLIARHRSESGKSEAEARRQQAQAALLAAAYAPPAVLPPQPLVSASIIQNNIPA